MTLPRAPAAATEPSDIELVDNVLRLAPGAVEALARYDGSVAWCVSTNAAYSRFSGFLPEPVARRIFMDDRAAVAGNMGSIGRAEVVKGGYRVSGRWAYGSGIMHSDWVIGGCVVLEGDAPRRKPGGGVETRMRPPRSLKRARVGTSRDPGQFRLEDF